MKKKIFCLFQIIVILVSAEKIFPQFDYGFDFSKAGSSGLQFLKIGVGARETALGEAVTGIVNDANSVFWNPAGLAYVEKREVIITHNQWLVDSKHNAAVIAYSLGELVVGLSAITLDINEFEETTALQPDGTGRMVQAGDLMIGFTAARRFTDRLSIGLQVKYVQEKLDDYKISNVLFDVGTIYYTGFRQLRLGFALQHFGPDMKLVDQEFRTPLLFRVSAADEIFSFQDFTLIAGAELVHPTDNVEWVNLGLELNIFKFLDLRGGYRFSNDLGKISFGIGLRPPPLADFNMKIDYSYTPSETVFSDIQRFTIGLAF
ncbi:MAG: PorV/PorQ family protein [Ignavibacteriales bacterium]|nr:MAG: PorV/PorQ family protein [Ignavibacteriales bacterium]